MNARLQIRLIRSGNLLPLSLVNATKHVPMPASNADRAQLLRAALPVSKWNAHNWNTLHPSSPANTPSLVAGGLEPDYAQPVSDEEMREAFQLKYG